MPFLRAYIHFVWCTKNRRPLLSTPELRQEVWYHMFNNASKKDIHIDTINGYQEHCHCVVSLGSQQTIGNIVKLIKGECSYWINKNKLCKQEFEWQDDYYAVSVSPNDLPKVREYIRNQENHHRHRSFQEEFDNYLIEWGFHRFDDGSVKAVG